MPPAAVEEGPPMTLIVGLPFPPEEAAAALARLVKMALLLTVITETGVLLGAVEGKLLLLPTESPTPAASHV